MNGSAHEAGVMGVMRADLLRAPLDVPRLAAEWRDALPFSHVVIDGLLTKDALAMVTAGVIREPYTLEIGEIAEGLMSSAPPVDPALRAFVSTMTRPATLEAIREVTGKPITSLHPVRSYLYHPGHFLLPHVDDPYNQGRILAMAFYTEPFQPCRGGELELFSTRLDGRQIVEATGALTIPAVANRLVLFDVGDGMLHQVREVLGGTRAAISGWFSR